MRTIRPRLGRLPASVIALAALLGLVGIILPARAAGHGATVDVSIGNGRFSPAAVHVHAGDTVVWTNNDSHDHSVAGDGFKSGNIGPGESYSHKFTRAGTYAYSCGYHPREKGTIVVE